MICENCKCKDDCGWYGSYKRIENEIYIGIGTDNTLGRALITAMNDNQLEECEYFEQLIRKESNMNIQTISKENGKAVVELTADDLVIICNALP